MAGSINKVILVGNLGKDPEVRKLENGATLARFSMATSETYKDKEGNKQTNTEWHNVVVWRGLAEVAEKYLRKGSLIYVEGKLKTRSWEDENKQVRYATEVVADNFTMLGGARENENQQNNSSSPLSEPEASEDASNMEDDLPF